MSTSPPSIPVTPPPERHLSSRVVLRCWRPGDGPALNAAVNASLSHLAPWMPWARQSQGQGESEWLVRQWRARWLLQEDFCIGVWDLDEARVLGATGFHLRHGPLSLGAAEIGMWIHADHARQGLGRHVLSTLVDWAFSDDWPWQRLVWRCDIDNHASRRLAERCRFHLEGVAQRDGRKADGSRPRDTATYALLRQGEED